MVSYIAWSNDYSVLEKSASGGIAYEFGRYVIRRNGIVMGVNSKGEWDYAETEKELKQFQGSKYWMPKKWKKVVKKMLQQDAEGREVLFIGTPCQCKAINTFPFNHIITVQIKCHGYDVKNKVTRGYDNPAIPWTQSGKYGEGYLSGESLNTRCKQCEIGNYGDITIGDAWNCHPSHINDMGTSRIEVNTEEGNNFLLDFHFNSDVHIEVEDADWRPKKVALLNIENQNNLGSSLLSTNLIAHTSLLEYVVILQPWGNNYPTMKRIIEGAGNRKGITFRSMIINGLHIPRYWLHSLSLPELKDCDTIIINGEDNWCGSTNLPERWRGWMIFLTLAILHGKQIYFINGTMGEIPWWVRPWFKWVLLHCKGVYVRDYWSVKQLEDNLNFTPTFCPDAGFLDPHNFKPRDTENFALYTPSVWARYCDKVDEYIEKCRNEIEEIQQQYETVIIMPHDDREVNIPIYERMSMEAGVPLVVPHSATEARTLYSKASEVWTYRMHSYIQCVSVGTKCNIIAPYSPKFSSMQDVVKRNSLARLKGRCKKILRKIENEIRITD